MKKIIVGSLAILFFITSLAAKKLYEVESGIVTMVTKTQVDMGFGSGESKITSNTTIHFIEYGNKIAVESKDVEESGGKKKTTKAKVVLENDMMYVADYEKKEIIKMNMSQMSNSDQMFDVKALKKRYNLKKTGTDKILGYKCDVYKSDKMEMCLYKGVALRSNSTIFGSSSSIATHAKFNTSISNSVFKLPDFPIMSMDDMMKDADGKAMNMEDIQKAISKELENLTPEQRKQMESLMQGIGGQN